jgi:hypothetical protein
MIGAKATNPFTLFLIFATAIGLLLIFIATGFIFTSSNPVSKFAMVIGGILLLIGAVQPRGMLLLLIPITFYLDGVKRLLVLVGKTSIEDVTSVLAIAPLTAVGILIGCVIHRIFRRRKGGVVEGLTIVSALASFVALGGMESFTEGNLVFGLRTAANSTVYFLLPWAVLQCYRTREDVERFLKVLVVAGVPVALYGIWQYAAGLNQFETIYLQSGLTMTGVNLDDIRPRPFSTLASPHPYSVGMAFMMVLSWHFFWNQEGRKRNWKGVFVLLAYAVALLLSMARGSVIAGAGMLVFSALFRSRAGVTGAYLFSAVVLGGLILFAQPLLDALDHLQSYLPGDANWQQQAFRLGTISDRLMGYRNILTNPGAWPLVANPLKFRGSDITAGDAAYSHDLLSQMILRIGIIPVFVVICMAGYFLWQAHRSIFRLPPGKGGPRPIAARLMAMLVVFLMAQSGGSGITVFPINFWISMFAGLLAVICIHDRAVKKRSPEAGGLAIVAPLEAGAR